MFRQISVFSFLKQVSHAIQRIAQKFSGAFFKRRSSVSAQYPSYRVAVQIFSRGLRSPTSHPYLPVCYFLLLDQKKVTKEKSRILLRSPQRPRYARLNKGFPTQNSIGFASGLCILLFFFETTIIGIFSRFSALQHRFAPGVILTDFQKTGPFAYHFLTVGLLRFKKDVILRRFAG